MIIYLISNFNNIFQIQNKYDVFMNKKLINSYS
jgi:hypothetical protein